MSRHLWLPLVALLFLSCGAEESTKIGLFFRGGMDSVSIDPDPNNAAALKFNGWNSLKNHPYVDGFSINNGGGTAYAYQEIVADPVNPASKAMRAVVIGDDPNRSGTTRAQCSLHFKPDAPLEVYHTSLRMYFHEDVAVLLNYPNRISWFDIFEAWTANVPEWPGDPAGSARWNLHIFKNEGESTFYWVAAGEIMQPSRSEMWEEENTAVPIPIGKWFTLDVALKRGAGTQGRYTIKMTVDGEPTQTLFDIHNTTIYPEHPEIPIRSWQAFKFYFDPNQLLPWVAANGDGAVLQCYYNDFIWYKK